MLIDVRGLLGNKKYLDQLGIKSESIKDWKSFRETLLRIKQENYVNKAGYAVEGFGFPGKSDWNIPHNFAPWVWSEGGRFLTEEKGQVKVVC